MALLLHGVTTSSYYYCMVSLRTVLKIRKKTSYKNITTQEHSAETIKLTNTIFLEWKDVRILYSGYRSVLHASSFFFTSFSR